MCRITIASCCVYYEGMSIACLGVCVCVPAMACAPVAACMADEHVVTIFSTPGKVFSLRFRV